MTMYYHTEFQYTVGSKSLCCFSKATMKNLKIIRKFTDPKCEIYGSNRRVKTKEGQVGLSLTFLYSHLTSNPQNIYGDVCRLRKSSVPGHLKKFFETLSDHTGISWVIRLYANMWSLCQLECFQSLKQKETSQIYPKYATFYRNCWANIKTCNEGK